ncbi:MAG: SUMF1/EgtB/PvdO family nonheme iron enzyme, partial [Thermoguttaceae bacterium]
TCDYMAPEQAIDTHAADHRSDIYSLGCTLYRLLTGQPPYQGETLMMILLAHQQAPIPSLCEARPEVPAELDAVYTRMLAKKAEDRYQSMAEVVGELEAVLAALTGQSVTAVVKAESSSAALSRTLAFLQEDRPVGTLTRQHKIAAAEKTDPHAGQQDTGTNIFGKVKRAVGTVRQRPLVLAGLAGGVVLLLGIMLTISLRHGTLTVEIDENLGRDVQVAVTQGGEQVQVADAKSGWTLSLGAGKYDLTVKGGTDQFQLDSQSVTVTHGGQVKVKVTLKPPLLAVAPFDATQARKHQEAWAKYLGVPVETTNAIGMKLVLIPPGEFEMGSPKELIDEELKTADGWYKDHLPGEGPRHRVRITQPFYLGAYDVTQGEYERVMGTNPSEFSATGKGKDKVAGQDTTRFPVECVTWDEAVEFCRKLSERAEEKAAGRRYRLPSEAQWEYACRAGSSGRYGFSSGRSGVPKEYEEHELFGYGWFNGNSDGMPHAAGLKRPSAWGLYDMHGNVWQWCQDWYDKDYYTNTPTDDPAGPSGGSDRVGRGGSWINPARNCRSALRNDFEPGDRRGDLGFRVSRVLADK